MKATIAPRTVENPHALVERTSSEDFMSLLRTPLVLAIVALAAACPEPVPVRDAGSVDPHVDDEDAGSLVDLDGGQVDCPNVTAFMEGEACVNEGQVCRSLMCIFPGPSCIELHCVDGVWSNPAAVDDAGVVDAGEPPIRTVHEAPLHHGLPLDNHFVDPELTLVSAAAWQLYNASSTDYVRAEHVVSSQLPLGKNAIRIRKSTNPTGVIALGAVRAPSGPSIVQIDVGRPVDAADAATDISLVGVFADGQPSAVALHPVAVGDDGDFVADGVQWRRYLAALDEAPIGFATLVVAETHGVDLLLAAPILVETDGAFSMGGLSWAAHRAERAPVSDAIAVALRRSARANGDRLAREAPAPRPITPTTKADVPRARDARSLAR